MRYLSLVTAISLGLLTACSSDSDDGGSNAPVNQSPSITLESTFTADEKSTVSISATASDSDGSIASYAWSVSSSENDIILADSDSATVTVTLPEVMQDTLRTLTLAVTDDDGDTASATVDITITQLTLSLGINGTVTDSPIANASIQVLVDGLDDPIETSADASGEYSIDLTLDDSLVDAFVSIQAFGTGEQENAGLISMLGTVAKLQQLAGEDSVLTADEYFATQVTNITTAQFGLLTQNTEDAITTDEALLSALSGLDYEQVLRLAAAIKVAIDKSPEDPTLALASGVSHTLELVSTADITTSYLELVEDTSAFADAVVELFSDPLLVDTFSTWDIPTAYYFVPQNGAADNLVTYFNTDNTGYFENYSYTWQLTDGELLITIDDTSLFSTNQQTTIDGQPTSVEVLYGTKYYSLKRIGSSDYSDTLLVTQTDVVQYPNGELTDTETNAQFIQLAYKNSPFVDIEVTTPASVYMAIDPELDENSGFIIADNYTLNADGTGAGLFSDNSLNWALVDGALVLSNISDKSTDLSIRYQQLPVSGTYDYYLYEEIENETVTFANVGKGLINPAQAQWNAATVPNIFWMIDGTTTKPDFKLWTELHEDGTAEYFTHDTHNGSTEYSTLVTFGLWSLLEDGTLEIVTGKNITSGESTLACRDYQTSGCEKNITYSFIPVQETSNGMAAILKQEFDTSFFYTVFTVMTETTEHLEDVADLLVEPQLGFVATELNNQALSIFLESQEFLRTLSLANDGTFSDNMGETGTWYVSTLGELALLWADSSSVTITLSEYPEDTTKYAITWSEGQSTQIANAFVTAIEDLDFTDNELRSGTHYTAWDSGEADCPGLGYVIEPFNFSSDETYTLDACYEEDLETGTYDLLANGNVRINVSDLEYIKKVAYNADIGGWLICYEKNAADLCTGDDDDLGYLIPSLADAQAYIDDKNIDYVFSIDLTYYTAVSTIINSDCTGILGGWAYSFTTTSMTLSGSDSWDHECDLEPTETITVIMTNLAQDFDIPFNCADFPTCTLNDLQKVDIGIDEDGRNFTSTFTFNQETAEMTYIKVVQNEDDDDSYTEVINFEW